MPYELTGLEGKVAVVTGAGRMRSIGRPIAVELARAGCDVVLTGTGRSPDRYPDDEKAAGWRDIESVADEVRAVGPAGAARRVRRGRPRRRRARSRDQALDELRPRRHRRQQRRRGARRRPQAGRRPRPGRCWRTVIDVNLTGTFLMSKVFGRRLVDGGQRRVDRQHLVHRRQDARPDTAAYAASKAGLQALTACMAQGGRRRTASASTPSAPASSTRPAWTTSAGARSGSR